MLLSFVKFQVKLINFDGVSKHTAILGASVAFEVLVGYLAL